MLVPFLVIFALIFVGIVLRFVQPKLLFGLRRLLREVRTNKATLDYEAGRSLANREFVAALMGDSRSETEDATASAARRRANKVRELYRILDPRNRLPEGVSRQGDPSVCVIELADLIRNLAQQLKPSLENNRAVIPSGSLLRYIGKTIRDAEGAVGDLTEHDLGSWYIENPISMEQVIEILIAVVEGVSFRLQAQQEVGSQVRREYSTGDRILRLERILRALVRATYLATYKARRPEERVKDVLGAAQYDQCTQRMERARAKGNANVDFLDFLYFRQLEQLIVADWHLFAPVLKDSNWFTSCAERMILARNDVTHSRELPRAEEEWVKRTCEEIAELVRSAVGW